MPDPVTATTAASTAADATQVVAKEGGGLISNLFTSPFKFLWGSIKGIFSNTVGNIFGTLLTSGIFAGVATLVPDFIKWLPFKIGDKKIGDIVSEDVRDGGTPALLKDSLIAGATINAAIGGLTGGFKNQDIGNGTGSTIGTVAGTALAMLAVGSVAIGALQKSGTGLDFNVDNGSKNPPPLPGAGAATGRQKA